MNRRCHLKLWCMYASSCSFHYNRAKGLLFPWIYAEAVIQLHLQFANVMVSFWFYNLKEVLGRNLKNQMGHAVERFGLIFKTRKNACIAIGSDGYAETIVTAGCTVLCSAGVKRCCPALDAWSCYHGQTCVEGWHYLLFLFITPDTVAKQMMRTFISMSRSPQQQMSSLAPWLLPAHVIQNPLERRHAQFPCLYTKFCHCFCLQRVETIDLGLRFQTSGAVYCLSTRHKGNSQDNRRCEAWPYPFPFIDFYMEFLICA